MIDVLFSVCIWSLVVVIIACAVGAVVMLWIMVRTTWRGAKETDRLVAELDAEFKERLRQTRERIERGSRMTEHRFRLP